MELADKTKLTFSKIWQCRCNIDKFCYFKKLLCFFITSIVILFSKFVLFVKKNEYADTLQQKHKTNVICALCWFEKYLNYKRLFLMFIFEVVISKIVYNMASSNIKVPLNVNDRFFRRFFMAGLFTLSFCQKSAETKSQKKYGWN